MKVGDKVEVKCDVFSILGYVMAHAGEIRTIQFISKDSVVVSDENGVRVITSKSNLIIK